MFKISERNAFFKILALECVSAKRLHSTYLWSKWQRERERMRKMETSETKETMAEQPLEQKTPKKKKKGKKVIFLISIWYKKLKV